MENFLDINQEVEAAEEKINPYQEPDPRYYENDGAYAEDEIEEE